MNKLLFLFLFPLPILAMENTEVERIADAIYKVEGGKKARAPYGILSVKVKGEVEARRVCQNTIKNNHSRWIKAGRPGNYIDFLADRYCPPSADLKGNSNWKKNIRKFLPGVEKIR